MNKKRLTRYLIDIAIAVALALALVFFLTDEDCTDTSKEPIGAQHPVECKP